MMMPASEVDTPHGMRRKPAYDTEDAEGPSFSLIDHLSELRRRMLRCVIYVALTAVAGWFAYPWIFAAISRPILPCFPSGDATFLLTGLAEGFSIKMKVAVATGAVLAMPAVLGEAWGFIAPGLLAHERRFLGALFPLMVVLFLAGVTSAYLLLPVGVAWLVQQAPPNAVLLPSVSNAISFVLSLLLACGVLYQYPIVVMGLARLGVVNSTMLHARWREALLVTFVLAAIITPSADALTMCLLAVPLLGLYGLSLLLVARIERRRGR